MEITGRSFDEIYIELLKLLNEKGEATINRKGDKLKELFDQKFTLLNPFDCFAFCRKASIDYLQKEFAFYLSGSDKLEDAIACSKFWAKCTDDGKTINSNYGKLLLYDKNKRGLTQLQHAVNCLKNARGSKKAVMTIYDKENAYISNDNPCTMFLQARIDENFRLHLTVHMRSSDIYYGLPYDVPFFVFIQHLLAEMLSSTYGDIRVGTYTHISGSLHKYARNEEALDSAFATKEPAPSQIAEFNRVFAVLMERGIDTVMQYYNTSESNEAYFMRRAWDVSQYARCLKKHVGACLTLIGEDGIEREICAFYGGVDGTTCTECVRDKLDDRYFGDECPSVHAEMRCITHAIRARLVQDFARVRIYVTHGPCDACLKFCNHVGIKRVYYDKPYKTNYEHWPEIEVVKLAGDNGESLAHHPV